MAQHEGPIYEFPLMIRESHIDTIGHVNNATYLEIFEDARWDLITKNGYGLKEVQEKQISPIILEINIKFLKELRNRENVVVRTQSIGFEGKIGKLKQTLVKSDGSESAVAIIIYGVFDMKLRKLIVPTSDWMKAVGMPA